MGTVRLSVFSCQLSEIGLSVFSYSVLLQFLPSLSVFRLLGHLGEQAELVVGFPCRFVSGHYPEPDYRVPYGTPVYCFDWFRVVHHWLQIQLQFLVCRYLSSG